MEKNIYVVVSRTNTKVGRTIRKITGYDYNHVSISLDDKLNEMYSFARYRNNSFLVGGFVRESILRYRDDENPVKIKMYKIELSESDYNEVLNTIETFKRSSSDYIYDTLGLVGIKRDRNKAKYKMYTCLSFANEVLERANAINDGKQIKSIRELQNRLKKYPSSTKELTSDHMEDARWHEDEYPVNDGKIEKVKKSVNHLKKVVS